MLTQTLEGKLLEGETISFEDALGVLETPAEELPRLVALSHSVRLAHCGAEVEVESIISAKTGGCSEDCTFCSQSRLWPGPVRPQRFIDIPQMVEAAKRSRSLGATEFCIVMAIRGPDDAVMDQVLESVEALYRETDLQVACSLGILGPAQARALAEAGVHRYNHNMETARAFFPQVCSTHTWEERRETCSLVKDAGMQLCSGGIFGMGETLSQRVQFAFELAELGPHEVPVNFLNPRPGTPLAETPLVRPLDAIRTISMLRLVMPTTVLRYAGGREVTLGDLQSLGMLAGINALIIGNYLTTLGRTPDQDLKMLSDLGMPVMKASTARKNAGKDRAPLTPGETSKSPTPSHAESYDPPRLCETCGRRLNVQVEPDTVVARCPMCEGTVRGRVV